MKKFHLVMAILFISLMCITSPTRADDFNLPDIGDSGAYLMTPVQERRIGEAVVHKLRRAGMIVDDPILTTYINQLGYRLLAHRDNPGDTVFTFFIVNDKSINAFALPGGFIGINYGLIRATDNEGELAAVMAHEIGHELQRHFARGYQMQKHTQLPIIAALIAAIVLGAHGNGDAGEAALATVAGASSQHEINFTRHNEEEADRVGIHLLAKAGFNPKMMAEFFEKLQRQSRLYGDNVPAFLLDHPVTSERITDALNRAAQWPVPKPHDEFTYMLMHARVIALSHSDAQKTAKTFLAEMQETQGEQELARRYGYMLCLMAQSQYQAAHKQVLTLLRYDPQRIVFLIAKADIDMHSGRMLQAIKTYENALKFYPANSALTYNYADALLQDHQYQKAANLLDTYLKSPTNNPDFYRLLARATTKTGKLAQAHEAMAEYYHQIGQLYQAIDQIKLALKIKHLDFYTTSRLEAQLTSIKQEVPASEK